jgi:hypothetical protein
MENLINRIRMMLPYVSKEEIRAALQKEGLDEGIIFLAYCAAVRLNEAK